MSPFQILGARLRHFTKTIKALFSGKSAMAEDSSSLNPIHLPWTESRIDAIVYGPRDARAVSSSGNGRGREWPTIRIQNVPMPDVVATQGGVHLALRLEAELRQDGKLVVFAGLTFEDQSSDVASQTGVALAELGVGPVLLLDANLQAPRLQQIHSVPDTPGLLELLRHKAALEQVLHATPIQNLTVLPTAEAEEKSASLLTDNAMVRLVRHLKRRYSFVIIDSSPLHGSIDASLIASISDGVVIVAAQGKRDSDEFLEATRMLDAVKARILGVAFSEATES